MSSSEKALLTKELDTLEDKKAIEGFIDDVETMGGHEDLVEIAKQKIEALEAKTSSVITPIETNPNETAQVNSLGGSNEVVAERIGSVDEQIVEKDQEIKSVTSEAEEKINLVKNETVEKPDANIESELAKQKQEKIKELDLEIGGLLDQIANGLPEKMTQLVNSESYKKLIDLNEKRKVEEQSLADLYFKNTEGNGEHRRIHFSPGEYANMDVYVDDLKFFNTPKDVIKRFEDYKDKFKLPENNAATEFASEYRKTIDEDRWNFEKQLISKSDEIFGTEGQNREDAKQFQKKYFDKYQTNYSSAMSSSIPGKSLFINTMGTIIYPPKK